MSIGALRCAVGQERTQPRSPATASWAGSPGCWGCRRNDWLAVFQVFLSVPRSHIDIWLISTRPSQGCRAARYEPRLPLRSLQFPWDGCSRGFGHVELLPGFLVNSSDGRRLAIGITPGRFVVRSPINRGHRHWLLHADLRRCRIRKLGAQGCVLGRRRRHWLPVRQLHPARQLGRRRARDFLFWRSPQYG